MNRDTLYSGGVFEGPGEKTNALSRADFAVAVSSPLQAASYRQSEGAAAISSQR
jgi:hypothetical protein